MMRPQDAHVKFTGSVRAIEQGTCARSSRDVTNISLLFPYNSKNATGVRVILFTFVRLSKITLGTGIPERLMHKETLCHAPALRFSTRDL